eukprot:TRINITY_DN13888_c0_g1_i1.p1 TRINITY_DN13888_c0_g1~~TRINITY_DN13888_c0_g1_i1.p1  ORF type:complete len:313 (+),score=34.94 TRINITY_DN13888_c0_g1_i1:144-1082(+)
MLRISEAWGTCMTTWTTLANSSVSLLLAALVSSITIASCLGILDRVLEKGLALVIVLSSLSVSFGWLCLSSYIARLHHRLHRLRAARLTVASSIAALVNYCIFMVDHILVRRQPEDMERLESVLPVAFGVLGLAMGTTLLLYTVESFCIRCAPVVQRYVKQKRFLRRPAQVVECDEMEAGVCMVCLENLSLAELPAELAHRPEQPGCTEAGLLQCPCKHVFHGTCVGRWLEQERTCPSCRHSVKDMGTCSRFVLSSGPRIDRRDATLGPEAGLRFTAGGEGKHEKQPQLDETLSAAPDGEDDESWQSFHFSL